MRHIKDPQPEPPKPSTKSPANGFPNGQKGAWVRPIKNPQPTFPGTKGTPRLPKPDTGRGE